MIELGCCSAKKLTVPESAAENKLHCPACGRVLQIVCGESLAEWAGAGDFDAALVAEPGSTLAVGRYVLGGGAEIVIGKASDCNIVLPGKQVSRHHCKLVRVDFGPSRWTVVDLNSTNGVLINGHRVTQRELADGDALEIGEFRFRYLLDGGVGEGSIGAFAALSPSGGTHPRSPVFQGPARGAANGMATAGMVLGILMCVPLCSLLAIIFSSIGLIRSRRPGVRGQGQAIAGLVLGIVGIPLSCSILIPAFSRAREQANRVKCAANMKQIGAALLAYENANQNAFPPSLDVLAQAEGLSPQTLSCPSAPSGESENYVLIAPGRLYGNPVMLYEPMSNHHEGINVLYSDGRVEFLPNPAAQQFVDTLPDINTPRFQGSPSQPRIGQTRVPGGAGIAHFSDENANTLPTGAIETAMVGGHGGSPYLRTDRERRIVTGFIIGIGSWSGHLTIGRCEPLWTTPTEAVPSGCELCMAKDGYAVGGVVVKSLDGADGIQVIFMKLTGDGVDAADSYTSAWYGALQPGKQTQLAGHGERVIGTFGRQGMNMDAIGLVVEPRPTAPEK